MNKLELGRGVGVLASLILSIVALATPAWRTSDVVDIGLFKYQSAIGEGKVSKGDAENVAIAFLIMGEIVLCAGIAGFVFGKLKDLTIFMKIGGNLPLVAGIFFLIGTASYTGLYADNIGHFFVWGYSFILSWISAAIALIIGGVGNFC